MDPLKPYREMTRKELLNLDHIPIGKVLDTEQGMVRAVYDFDQYLRENPGEFELVFVKWYTAQPWYPTQLWDRVEIQSTDICTLRTVYFLWKLSEGKIKKQFRKVLPRVLQTRRTGDEQRR